MNVKDYLQNQKELSQREIGKLSALQDQEVEVHAFRLGTVFQRQTGAVEDCVYFTIFNDEKVYIGRGAILRFFEKLSQDLGEELFEYLKEEGIPVVIFKRNSKTTGSEMWDIKLA